MQLTPKSIRFAAVKGERNVIYHTLLPDSAVLKLQCADNC